jgi:hypothetical protein
MRYFLLLQKNLVKSGKIQISLIYNRELLPDKTTFLGLLETLARADETVVREQATKSLTTISKSLSDTEIQNQFITIVLKLASGEWFTGRVSSCALFFPAYSRAGP